jgi:hypothetical protein
VAAPGTPLDASRSWVKRSRMLSAIASTVLRMSFVFWSWRSS